MPQRETRQSIERGLAAQKPQRRRLTSLDQRRMLDDLELELAKIRGLVDPATFVAIETKFREGVRKITVQMRKKRRRPGDGSMPALVEPPRGPRPLSGGAAAALEFDE